MAPPPEARASASASPRPTATTSTSPTGVVSPSAAPVMYALATGSLLAFAVAFPIENAAPVPTEALDFAAAPRMVACTSTRSAPSMSVFEPLMEATVSPVMDDVEVPSNTAPPKPPAPPLSVAVAVEDDWLSNETLPETARIASVAVTRVGALTVELALAPAPPPSSPTLTSSMSVMAVYSPSAATDSEPAVTLAPAPTDAAVIDRVPSPTVAFSVDVEAATPIEPAPPSAEALASLSDVALRVVAPVGVETTAPARSCAVVSARIFAVLRGSAPAPISPTTASS